MIRNVLFDMGGVLIRFDPAAFIARLGVGQEDGAVLYNELFHSLEWVSLDRGVLTEAEVIERVCGRVPARLRAAVAELVTGWDRPVLPVEGMYELCAELQETGYELYLLTNAGPRHREYWFGFPVSRFFPEERILRSADWRLLKPERAFYDKAAELFGLSREECVFIDDSPINAEAAQRAGIRSVVFHGSASLLRRDLAAAGVKLRPE